MGAEQTVFSNAQIVMADRVVRGCVRIEGAVIETVDDGTSRHGIDLEGDFLIPGLVELHTDHLESHYAPRPAVRWNPLAAVQAHDAQIATSGITTVLDALRVGSDGDADLGIAHMRELADAIGEARAWGRLRAEHFIHLRCEISSRDVTEHLEALWEREDVLLASVMDHTPGQRQFASLDKYREYYQGRSGMSDAEMDRYIATRLEAFHLHASDNRQAVVQRCNAARIALASHDDATRDHVEEAAREGVRIAEFPTTREAAAAARVHGLAVLMGAPNLVRGGSHSGNVSALELADAGCLDILSSRLHSVLAAARGDAAAAAQRQFRPAGGDRAGHAQSRRCGGAG